MKISVDQIEGLAEWLAAQGLGGSGGGAGGMPGSKISYVNSTTISVSPGRQRDSTNSVDIEITSVLRKNLNGMWVPGDNQFGRTYQAQWPLGWHVHAIYNAATKAVDVCLTPAARNPVLPAGFTHFRRLGAVMVAGDGAIRDFVQTGRRFDLKSPVQDYQVVPNGGAPSYRRRISVPQDKKMLARFYMQSFGDAVNYAGAYHSGVYDPDLPAPAFGTPSQYGQIRRFPILDKTGLWGSYGAGMFDVMTNLAGEVMTASNDPSDSLVFRTLGWTDGIDELI